MNSQFKNPLGGKNQSAPQNDAWLTGGVQPAVPSAQAQGHVSPAGLPEQPTIKQPSITSANVPNPNAFHGGRALPQTPGGYVQGQHGRYGPGPGPMPPVGANTSPQGSGGPQMFTPPQPRPGMGSSFSAPTYNTFNQTNAGSSFSRPGATMLAAPPPALGTFNPNRPPQGPGTMGPGGRGYNGPPGPLPGGKRKKKRRVPIWARVVIGFLSFLLIITGGGLLYYQVNFGGAVSNIVGQQVARAKDEGNPNANLNNGILSGPRVNILLLGSDTDQKFQGNYLAQTDIVVTVDPSSKTVGMLSIPRDFYINVPGYGLHKLDEAYDLGGVDLSRRTIEQDFGISINYYAWVGLDGFIKVINTVNGVDVDVLHPIVDGEYPDDTGANANNPYAFKRLYLTPGPQHLDGPTALEYVRSRHADLVGDFGRSARQQQVLSALKTKLVDPNIFGKLTEIANDLNGSVKTDMQLPDILKLMNFARGINANQINKLTLGPPYSHSGTSPNGSSVVVPDCARIIPAISQFLQLRNNAACNIGYTGDPQSVATGTSTGTNQPLTTPAETNQPAPLTTPISGNNAQDLGNMASNATAGLGNGPSDLFGVRSLLDLLLLGAFESPDAFQV
ncbi:MAG: LCP family protein [Ktedonobacteraceae bacterium]